jgi:hypothetical protein
MARRFNIGDRVVRFYPSVYSNLFHKDKYVDYGVVTDANDERFTTSGKLTFKHVKGGVILVDTDFTIK